MTVRETVEVPHEVCSNHLEEVALRGIHLEEHEIDTLLQDFSDAIEVSVQSEEPIDVSDSYLTDAEKSVIEAACRIAIDENRRDSEHSSETLEGHRECFLEALAK